MSIQLTDSLKNLLKETAKQLKGAAKRKFIAQTVAGLGHGGQLKAEQELGWNRVTISKGIKELTSGITCVDNYRGRGRYKAESHLPNLLSDIKNLVDGQSQIDPSFKSQRLYTRLSASVVKLVTETYELGVKLTKEAMSTLEKQIKRLTDSSHETFPDLGKWFIDIHYGAT